MHTLGNSFYTLFIAYVGTLLTSPVSCLLTYPGPLCPGDMAALTCNITGGQAQLWLYNNIEVGMPIAPALGRVPEVPAVLLMADGANFDCHCCPQPLP
jgi:hypothetical protein